MADQNHKYNRRRGGLLCGVTKGGFDEKKRIF